jgi:peptide/nickel transport system permease protein
VRRQSQPHTTMFNYLAKRLAAATLTILIVALIVFLFIRLIPGDPVEIMFGDTLDPSRARQMRGELRLDDPLLVQFWVWIRHAATGDLGISLRLHQPVSALIVGHFGVSAIIILASVSLAAIAAVPAGMIAAWQQDSALDIAITTGATLLLSLPSFWLGLVMLLTFGVYLGWLPVIGFVPFSENLGEALRYLIMPVLTLALIETGVLTRMARANTIETLGSEYVTHARAKGLPESIVLRRHVFPNAFAPTMTLIGLIIGNLLAGIAIVESVFTIPGIGKLLIDGIFNRDYPVIQGCLLVISLSFVVINLVVDFLYPIFDPRILKL